MMRPIISFFVLSLVLGLSACNGVRPFLGVQTQTPEVSGRLFLAGSNVKAAAAPALRSQSLGGIHPDTRIPGELVLSLQPGLDPARILAAIPGVAGWEASSPTTIRVRVQPGLEDRVLQALERLAGVNAVSHNQRLRTLATPNDTSFSLQANLRLIGMPAAWDIEKGSADILVAVIDDGYDPSVADMQDRTALPTPPGGYYLDPAERDNDPRPLAISPHHGDEVASIIAAATDNASGIAGVTWQGVQVVPIKVEGLAPDNPKARVIELSSLAAGIDTAVQLRVKVINISLGLVDGSAIGRCIPGASDAAIDASLERAHAAGIVIIASSGNDSGSTVCYPASNRHVIAVGSVDASKAVSGFSTRGAALDLVAPGSNVLALSASGTQIVSGTSFSAPTVAGVAALLASQGLTSPDVITARLIETSEDLGGPGRDDSFGNGMVRADRALAADDSLDPTQSYALDVTFIQGGRPIERISSSFKKGRSLSAYALRDLAAGAYTVRAHVDVDGDGAENSGDYLGERGLSYNGGGLYGQDITLERIP